MTCVHHINGQQQDNRPENLWLFRTKADHKRFHQTGEYHLMDDGTFISPKWLQEKICPVCKKKYMSYRKNEIYCSIECRGISVRKVKERPSKNELKRLLITNNFNEIGRLYNVSGNAVRYWCKHYNISQHKDSLKELRKENKTYLDIYNVPILMKLPNVRNCITFKNIREVIKYVRYKELTNASDRTIKEGVLRVIHGKRKTYLNRGWTSPKYTSELEKITAIKKEMNSKFLKKQLNKRKGGY